MILFLLFYLLITIVSATPKADSVAMDLFMEPGGCLKLKGYPFMIEGLAIMAKKKMKNKILRKAKAAAGN
ncbi:hypothetical protein CL6EHI_c00048 [Entamoeba histolytica]|uniref:Single tm domain protein n=3 Tax=Entamoeba TaxID=5758 RepID=A0A175JHA1_ENTHI|nr:hypothetical protein ENU1_053230 [Entamoeba nuttalli P19]EKE41518.1 hypothetical protein ENU1_053230 [Entamoeba nuttalli P19]GAT92844.1 hypothetical protein CL6EHI_c00048 [Entamoeba histolytica]|eukprot:XP_008856144.1 hypothetical protein ENU1_053230 [Entamoeba nuttalli P19]